MCKQTIKHNSYLTKEILSEEILNHDLDALRKDLLAFYEIRDADVLNVQLKAHFPKREKLINSLVDMKLKEMEMELNSRAIEQNGKKIFYTILVAAGVFILSLFQEAKSIIVELNGESIQSQVAESPFSTSTIEPGIPKLSKSDQSESSEPVE
jgi:hypothetical protein